MNMQKKTLKEIISKEQCFLGLLLLLVVIITKNRRGRKHSKNEQFFLENLFT